jgi:gliding motility-associated-like protein
VTYNDTDQHFPYDPSESWQASDSDGVELFKVQAANEQCVTQDSSLVRFEKIQDFKMQQDAYVLNDTLKSSVILTSTGGNIDNWKWSFGDGDEGLTAVPQVEHRYLEGTYSGKVTPNGDGKNDVFEIVYTGNILNYVLKIFNRYGKIIFQTKDPLDYWTGKDQPSEIYYFDVQLGNTSRKGWVQVVK